MPRSGHNIESGTTSAAMRAQAIAKGRAVADKAVQVRQRRASLRSSEGGTGAAGIGPAAGEKGE
jgi:hypothetical protein